MSTGHISAFEVTRLLAGARLGRRGPLYLVHALTARCNARCGFCAWNPDFYDPLLVEMRAASIRRKFVNAIQPSAEEFRDEDQP